MKSKPRAIVFDLYGVLALNGWQAFKARHFTERPEIWDKVFEIGRKVDAGLEDYAELLRYTSEQSGVSEREVRHELEHTVPNEELLKYISHDIKPYFKVGLLSNASTNVLPDIFMSDQLDLFDATLLSYDTGLTKPDAEMYRMIAMKLEADVTECLFVDDQERHATGARDAGMSAIVFTDVVKLKEDINSILADAED